MSQTPTRSIESSIPRPRRRPDPVATSSLPADIELREMRSLPNPRDTSLSKLALAWFDQIPLALRPNALFELYPRVANRIALCWDDKDLLGMLFDDLLSDRRGSRRGFPAAVKCEMLALLDLANPAAALPPTESSALRETEEA